MGYIEEKDPELAELLRGTCADMTLNSTKGKPGITFLWPQDKAYRAKIAELAYSANPDDASKACDMLNALILRDVFKTASDFRRPVIPNSLYPSQQLDAKVEGSKVSFGSGAVATVDSDFKDASKKRNLAVWKLTGGEIPVTTDKLAKIERGARPKARGKSGNKAGGYIPSDSHARKERFQIALVVENEYAMERLKNQMAGKHSNDPFIQRTASLVQFLQKKGYDMAEIVPMLSRMKLDFYILVQPHQADGQYIVKDDDLAEWWATQPVPPSDINAFYDGLLDSQAARMKEAHEKRKTVLEKSNGRPRDTVAYIRQAYKDFCSGDDGLAERKMVHDDLRYMTCLAFHQLESGSFDTGKFNEIVNMIGEALHSNSPVLLNENTLKFSVDPKARLQEIQKFVNSSLFLHVHCKGEEAGIPKSTTDVYAGDGKLINFNKVAFDSIDRVKGQNVDDLVNSIADEKVREQVKKLLSK
jgi:hypothetical protein